jgi:hypothetical protein
MMSSNVGRSRRRLNGRELESNGGLHRRGNHVVGVFSMYRPDQYLAVVMGLMHVSDPEHGSATRPTHKNDAA